MLNRKTWAKASVLSIGLYCLFSLANGPAARAQAPPRYKYDPDWPKELPNNWTIEGITGMFVDKEDHIWVLRRPRDFDKTENYAALTPPTAECCVQPPTVLEFDTDGNLLKSWGGPVYVPGWPSTKHTIFVDREKNVWLGGAGGYSAEVYERWEVHLGVWPPRTNPAAGTEQPTEARQPTNRPAPPRSCGGHAG
jgi:hypothetical protein